MSELLRIMPPHEGAGAAFDWAAIERRTGLRFPADYRAFVTAYGDGSIDAILGIMVPDEGDCAGMTEETELARDEWHDDLAEHPDGVTFGADDLQAWGVSGAGDLLCWARVDEDPDRWHVATWSRGSYRWRVYPYGTVEFLRRYVSGELTAADENPLSVVSGVDQPPMFLTQEEESRRYRPGLDPWS
ncbi:SMI1/KNR4 family protein [Streptomyces sp. VRA16 Mangrove soil]|uniref:SMI1/KNR4 family protein n=1 Tax=Streptomyces sp. VRA16 Mangrove soil TaxID=2817434 RepID=UPI001A9E0DC0|nr:SMI1/KNR4 family protein [Streptomyces sp. VRA16 Mangrove soil]MBO1336274.1 SMI1/KNR4 family protein [Streptomyces sp. VRA16 Mangrove soil]